MELPEEIKLIISKLNDCNKILPEKGTLVVALILKELVFQGEDDVAHSFWEEDGHKEKTIIGWAKLPYSMAKRHD